MPTLVLLRHGESEWNRENRFTGWTDVDLSPAGVTEAENAAALIRQVGLRFDVAFASVLKRAVRTLWIVLDKLDTMWIPQTLSWRLNERHYGALQGLNKAETTAKYGEEQVFQWRRSYDIRPPALAADDPRWPGLDPRYGHLQRVNIPVGESLEDTVARVLPFWHRDIVPLLRQGQDVLIVAHGNSLRGLVKYLDNVPDQDIAALNIPTGIPLQYTLDHWLKPVNHTYLGDS